MSKETISYGPEQEKEKPVSNTPETEKKKKKGDEKHTPQWLKWLFVFGVFVVGVVLFGHLIQKDLVGLIKNPIFLVFAGALVLVAVYNIITGQDALATAATCLTIEIIVLGAMLLVPWGWGKTKDLYGKHFPHYSSIPVAAPATYTPVVSSTDYDDSDPSFLEKGLLPHHFVFTDSGTATNFYGLKKDVSDWHLFIRDSKNKQLLFVFENGDTLKCWDKNQHLNLWGKKFKMIALEPMKVDIKLD
jgi:hypothetical protein